MAVFDNRSITSKALTLGVAPAVCVLVLVSAAFFLTSYLLARRSLARDMDALAVVVRDNVSAALAFNDRSTATDVLSALRAKQNVDGVCVFNSDGLLFASYSTGGFHCAPTVIEAESLETPRNVRAEPVMVGQRRVGVVQLVGNYDDLIEWMTIQAAITALALVAGSLLAFVLARRMERAISRPVIELAAVAREVTATGDYTVRAKRTTDDEVGALATSLNTMLEQIQHHNRMKDEFLAALSHELRTPLNAILGWLQIIRSTKLEPEPLERALSSVDRNARAQARLVEDLLDVSRIVTGKLQMARQPVDLRAVVAAAVDALAPMLSHGVRISTDVPDSPCLVSGDPDRLRQVVGNVLSNGVKFTPPGGLVSLSLRQDGDSFVISVSDTGVGISPEFLPYVFDRFRQSDGSTTRVFGGLGLGLAIVKDITELHGGNVTAASAGQGQGSTFTIRLPQLVDTRTLSDEAERDTGVPEVPEASLLGIRAIALDDDPDALEVVAACLRSAGASVDIVRSVDEDFYRLWAPGRYDVFVCDISMPRMDGFDVLKRLRDLDLVAASTVTVALTGHADSKMRERSSVAGFDAHVTKPVKNETFVSLITQLMMAKAPSR